VDDFNLSQRDAKNSVKVVLYWYSNGNETFDQIRRFEGRASAMPFDHGFHFVGVTNDSVAQQRQLAIEDPIGDGIGIDQREGGLRINTPKPSLSQVRQQAELE